MPSLFPYGSSVGGAKPCVVVTGEGRRNDAMRPMISTGRPGRPFVLGSGWTFLGRPRPLRTTFGWRLSSEVDAVGSVILMETLELRKSVLFNEVFVRMKCIQSSTMWQCGGRLQGCSLSDSPAAICADGSLASVYGTYESRASRHLWSAWQSGEHACSSRSSCVSTSVGMLPAA